MARIPSTRNDDTNTPEDSVPDPAPVVTGLAFEEPVESMPGAAEVNAVINPFQDAVNKLAQDPRGHAGQAIPVVLEPDQVKWARTQIRRAAANINRGARTKDVAIKEGPHAGKVRVYFTIGDKIERKS